MKRCNTYGCRNPEALPGLGFCVGHGLLFAFVHGMIGTITQSTQGWVPPPTTPIPTPTRLPDHYKTLGARPSASSDEIKKAYRKRALRFHPDRKGGSHEKMQELNAAYAVLGDEAKRRAYDWARGLNGTIRR